MMMDKDTSAILSCTAVLSVLVALTMMVVGAYLGTVTMVEIVSVVGISLMVISVVEYVALMEENEKNRLKRIFG